MDIYPTLTYRDASAAIDWLERAFGLERHEVHEDDAGVVQHAELKYGDGMVMLGSEREESPYGSHAGQCWLYMVVEDTDAHYARAREAGAEVLGEPADTDYGSRDYSARDLEGNLWSFGTYRPS